MEISHISTTENFIEIMKWKTMYGCWTQTAKLNGNLSSLTDRGLITAIFSDMPSGSFLIVKLKTKQQLSNLERTSIVQHSVSFKMKYVIVILLQNLC